MEGREKMSDTNTTFNLADILALQEAISKGVRRYSSYIFSPTAARAMGRFKREGSRQHRRHMIRRQGGKH